MEADTAAFIEKLQKQGVNISLCTAREKNIWYWLKGLHVKENSGLPVANMTINQLQSVEIRMLHDPLNPLCAIPYFESGIHFVPHNTKGEYFTEEMLPILKAQNYNGEYIFIDDNDSHCFSMANALSKAGISHRCYYYRAVEELAKHYNPLIANIQLYACWQSKGAKILSDQQAQELAMLHPEKEAEWYLKPVIVDVLHT